MKEVKYSQDSWLQEQLASAVKGEDVINSITRDDARVAHIIAFHTKTSYETGVECLRPLRSGEYSHDSYTEWEIAKNALESLDAANRRAGQKAHELGLI